jgi:hypothetical protein
MVLILSTSATLDETLNRVIMYPWKTLEEDYIAFLLLAKKCTNCTTQVLMLELSKTDS